VGEGALEEETVTVMEPGEVRGGNTPRLYRAGRRISIKGGHHAPRIEVRVSGVERFIVVNHIRGWRAVGNLQQVMV
jgi:hypothetical protein